MITAECVYDYAAIKTIFRRPGTIASFVLLLVLGAFSFVLMLSDLLMGCFSLSMLFLSIMAFFLAFFLYFYYPYRFYRSRGCMTNAHYTYEFHDDMMVVKFKANGIAGGASMRYEAIYAVRETFRYFIIYQSRHSFYLVDKTLVHDLPPAQLQSFLRGKIENYKTN